MPTYEYACEKCGHAFETHQSIKDNALKVCPKELCPRKTWGKGKVKRAVGGGAGLIFKGSGFYIPDYRSDKYKAAAKSDSNAAGNSSAASAGEKSRAESKPATPAPAPAPKPSKT